MNDPTPQELALLDKEMGSVEDWEEEFKFLAKHGFKIVRIDK